MLRAESYRLLHHAETNETICKAKKQMVHFSADFFWLGFGRFAHTENAALPERKTKANKTISGFIRLALRPFGVVHCFSCSLWKRKILAHNLRFFLCRRLRSLVGQDAFNYRRLHRFINFFEAQINYGER